MSYDKFMNWLRQLLWDEKLGKTVTRQQPSAAPVKIVGTPTNQAEMKMEPVKPQKPEPIKWVKMQLTDDATSSLKIQMCWI